MVSMYKSSKCKDFPNGTLFSVMSLAPTANEGPLPG